MIHSCYSCWMFFPLMGTQIAISMWETADSSGTKSPSWLNICTLGSSHRAVTTTIWITPSHHWSFRQNGGKCTLSCLNLLDTLEVFLDFRAVTTTISIAPSHHWSFRQDGGKCEVSCLNLLDTLELILDFRAVTTTMWRTPCDNPVTFTAKQCESESCCGNLRLYGNGCQAVSIFKSCSLQRQCRVHHVMVCSHKPQEAKLKLFLRLNPQVPYFGGLWNWKLLTATAWQSYIDLTHAGTLGL